MLLKGLYHNFHLRIAVFVLLTIAGTYLALRQEWVWFVPVLSVWAFLLRLILLSDKRNAQKVAFMFDAIDNSDYAFRYATRGRSSNDKLVSESLNRITQILFQAKADAAQKEKYYELIMNCVNTGIIVLDDNGVIYQTNNESSAFAWTGCLYKCATACPYRREPESRHTKHSAWRQAPDILCQRARQRSSVHPRFGDDATGQACTHFSNQ